MSARGRSDGGAVIAACGSLAIGWSLWQPWYGLRVPGALLDQAVQSSSQYGILGPIVREGAAMIRQLGPLHATAWQVMTGIPAVLLIVSVIAGGVSLLALTDRASGVGSVLACGGLIGVAVAAYALVEPPGASGLLHAAWGLYVAMAGAGAVLAGGLVAGSGEHVESTPVLRGIGDSRATSGAWPTPK